MKCWWHLYFSHQLNDIEAITFDKNVNALPWNTSSVWEAVKALYCTPLLQARRKLFQRFIMGNIRQWCGIIVRLSVWMILSAPISDNEASSTVSLVLTFNEAVNSVNKFATIKYHFTRFKMMPPICGALRKLGIGHYDLISLMILQLLRNTIMKIINANMPIDRIAKTYTRYCCTRRTRQQIKTACTSHFQIGHENGEELWGDMLCLLHDSEASEYWHDLQQ